MKAINKILLLSFVGALFFSCKKDDVEKDEDNEQVNVSDKRGYYFSGKFNDTLRSFGEGDLPNAFTGIGLVSTRINSDPEDFYSGMDIDIYRGNGDMTTSYLLSLLDKKIPFYSSDDYDSDEPRAHVAFYDYDLWPDAWYNDNVETSYIKLTKIEEIESPYQYSFTLNKYYYVIGEIEVSLDDVKLTEGKFATIFVVNTAHETF